MKPGPALGVCRPSDLSDDCDRVDCCDVSSWSGTPSGPVGVDEGAGDSPPGGALGGPPTAKTFLIHVFLACRIVVCLTPSFLPQKYAIVKQRGLLYKEPEEFLK